MRLLFQQRMFSWLDSYDVFDEAGNTVFTVKGQLSWGHCLKIFDPMGNELGTVREVVFSFMPQFELYLGNSYFGCIKKEFAFFRQLYSIDSNGWKIEGDFIRWDYTIFSPAEGATIATISKQPINWTDTYIIDIQKQENVLCALMFVLAMDAEKCSRDG